MLACKTLLPNAETRMLHLRRLPPIPDGDYALLEFYCDEVACDCRTVIINVVANGGDKILATISYGWESLEYYLKWAGNFTDAVLCLGPYLDPLNQQSEYSPLFLQLFNDFVLEDKSYVERLKRHYTLFKAALKRKKNPLKLVNPTGKPKKRHRW